MTSDVRLDAKRQEGLAHIAASPTGRGLPKFKLFAVGGFKPNALFSHNDSGEKVGD